MVPGTSLFIEFLPSEKEANNNTEQMHKDATKQEAATMRIKRINGLYVTRMKGRKYE